MTGAKIWVTRAELQSFIAEAIKAQRCGACDASPCECDVVEQDVIEDADVNPWAVCTASTGRNDKRKYERCVQGVKRQNDE